MFISIQALGTWIRVNWALTCDGAICYRMGNESTARSCLCSQRLQRTARTNFSLSWSISLSIPFSSTVWFKPYDYAPVLLLLTEHIINFTHSIFKGHHARFMVYTIYYLKMQLFGSSKLRLESRHASYSPAGDLRFLQLMNLCRTQDASAAATCVQSSRY